MTEKYVITSAVNNSKVFKKGLESLQNYCNYNNATLKVLPIKYNPQRLTEEELIYDKSVQEFLEYKNFQLMDVVVLPEIKVLPTASKPLSGFSSVGYEFSAIIAHPRLHLNSVATLTRGKPKFLLTTGSITEENYTISKTGAKAEFHHSYGFVVVEVDINKGVSFIRQVSIDSNGTICDLDKRYTKDAVELISPEAIVFGDLHMSVISPVVLRRGIMDDDSLLKTLMPKNVILHDLLSSESVSHHNIGDFFRQMYIKKSEITLAKELQEIYHFLQYLIYSGYKPTIVSSNHNDHLTKFLNRVMNNGFREIGHSDIPIVCELISLMIDYINTDDSNSLTACVPDVFKLFVDNRFKDLVHYVTSDKPHKIATFEVSLHGDVGINGARSLANLHSHTNTKAIHGHTHSANRTDGVLTVGTSSELNLSYNQKGLSTWSWTHVVIHPNNKAQHITQNEEGDFAILSRATSTNTVINYLNNVDFIPHFVEQITTKPINSAAVSYNRNKYTIKNTQSGEEYGVNKWREIANITGNSKAWSRRLILHGNKDNWCCIKNLKTKKEKYE